MQDIGLSLRRDGRLVMARTRLDPDSPGAKRIRGRPARLAELADHKTARAPNTRSIRK